MNIDNMSLEEKVGQLFLVSLEGTKANGEVIHIIKGYHVSGFYLLPKNMMKPKQVHQLSKNLQLYANKKLPLFLAAEQAGDKSNSLQAGMTQGPDFQTLFKVNNRLYTKQMAEIIGEELRALGINMNFAPTLETELFDQSIDLTAKHGIAAIQGYQNSNITAALTYFPGNDSILQEGLLEEPYEEKRSFLYPYYYMIQKGVEAMIVSETMYRHDTVGTPAQRSPSILHTLVRDKLNYEGLLLATFDSLKKADEIAPVAISAIQSGIDLLVLRHSYETQVKVIDKVIEAVREGVIAESEVNKSVERILALKKKRQIGAIKPFDKTKLQKKRSLALVEKLQEKINPTVV